MTEIDDDTRAVMALKEKAEKTAATDKVPAAKKTKKSRKKPAAAKIEYVCMTDCWDSTAKRYYKRGHVLVCNANQKCPPHFKPLNL